MNKRSVRAHEIKKSSNVVALIKVCVTVERRVDEEIRKPHEERNKKGERIG